MNFKFPGSFPIGRLFGIPVRLHVLFIVILGAQLLGSLYYGPRAVLLWFLLLGPVLLRTVFIHELGHCLAARSVGGQVTGILLWPLGGLAFIGHNAGPKADMWVAVAGPLTHVPMVGFWLVMLVLAIHHVTGQWALNLDMPYPKGDLLWQSLCSGSVIVNLSLLAFNLLVPAYPLDGGRMFVDLLLVLGCEEYLAAKLTIGLAVPIALGVIAFGIAVFQMVTILVGVFILWSSFQLFQFVRSGALHQHPMFSYREEGEEPGAAFVSPVAVSPEEKPPKAVPQEVAV